MDNSNQDSDALADSIMKSTPQQQPAGGNSDAVADSIIGNSTRDEPYNPDTSNLFPTGSAADIHFATSKVLKAFGQSLSDNWGAAPFQKNLKQTTQLKDSDTFLSGLLKSTNESFYRVPALLGDIAYTGLAELGEATTGVAGAAQNEARRLRGTSPVAATLLGEGGDILGAFGSGQYLGTGIHAPHVSLEDAANLARSKGAVAEGESGYFNTKPVDEEAITRREDAAKETGTKPVIPPKQPNLDVDDVARQINPTLFDEYDAKVDYHDELTQRLKDLQPEPGYEDLPGILPKSPELVQTEEAYNENYNRLQELQTEVDAAYRHANDILPSPKEIEEIKAKEPEAPTAKPAEVLPPEVQEQLKAPKGFIANEVSQRLVKLGRPEEEAQAAGQLIEAHYNSRAIRFGGKLGTGSDLYNKDFPTLVQGEGPSAVSKDVQTLNQTKAEEFTAAKTSVANDNKSGKVEKLFKEPEYNSFLYGRAAESKYNEYHEYLHNKYGDGVYNKATEAEKQKLSDLDIRTIQKNPWRLLLPKIEGTDYESYNQATRGSLSLVKNGRNILRLFKSANPSTFIHESGHQWLEELYHDARSTSAPDDLKQDWGTVQKFLRVKDPNAPLTRGQHEKFARTFERYMREGIAPSKELATVFEKFRAWLTNVYKQVSQLRAPINDDIRAVFDRLIAPTEEAEPTEGLKETSGEPTNQPELVTDEPLEQSGTSTKHKRLPEVKGTGETVKRGLASRVSAESVENELSEGFEDLPEYARLSIKDQSIKATELTESNPDRAYEIAMGERAAPAGMTPESIWVAVKNTAIAEGDVQKLRDLAHSRLTSEVTTMAQRLRSLNEGTEVDPVKLIRNIEASRDEFYQREGKSPTERLKLKNLSYDETKEILDLTKKVKDAKAYSDLDPSNVDARIAYGRALLDLKDRAEELKPNGRSWLTVASDAWDIPKTVQTSIFHFSAPFVQAWGMMSTKVWWQGFGQMIRYFADENNYQNLQAYIISHPYYQHARAGRLGLTDLSDKLSDREEAIRSTLVEAANRELSERTGIPNLVRASSRSFTGFLNYVRFNRFAQLVDAAKLAGEDTSLKGTDGKPNSVLKDLADVVNNFTGRGNLGDLDRYNNIVPVLNKIFYAPRKMVATAEMFNPVNYVKPGMSNTARMAAIRQLSGSLIASGAVLGIAVAMGAKVDWNPQSQNFGKIQIGKEKLDFTGGNAIFTRLVARITTGKEISSRDKETTLGQGYKPTTKADLIMQYVRGKLSPTASAITDALVGTDPVGNEFSVAREARQKMMPILFNNLLSMWEQNPDETAAYLPALSAIFGVGLESPLPPLSKSGLNVWGDPVSDWHDPIRTDLDNQFDDLGYTPSFPGTTVNGVQLTADQYHDYVALAGSMSKNILHNITSQSSWNTVPNDQKLAIMKDMISTSRTTAQSILMAQPKNRQLLIDIAMKGSPALAQQETSPNETVNNSPQPQGNGP